MSDQQTYKPVVSPEAPETKSLLWAYRFLALALVSILLVKTYGFVEVATGDFERPSIALADTELLTEKQKMPIANEVGVVVYQLSKTGMLEASIAENGAQVAPSKYLGWSLYKLDPDAQSWTLVDEARGDRFASKDLGNLISMASAYFMLECSVRPGVFSGKTSVSDEKVTRALKMNPDMVKSIAYIVCSSDKKTAPKPKIPAVAPQPNYQPAEDESEPDPVEPEQSTKLEIISNQEEAPKDEIVEETPNEEIVEETMPEVDLRTSITGADVEHTETVVAESADGESASTSAIPQASIAIPPRRAHESSEMSALADFEGNLPEMDIKISWNVSGANLVALLKKYTMAFYAPTDEAYRSQDGDWSCYVFRDQKTLMDQEFWGVELESALKNYGNLGPGYGDIPNELKKAIDAALPPVFGGEVNQGVLLLGSAILVANDAVVKFSESSASAPFEGSYEVQLRFTNLGEVIATNVKEKVSR